MTRGNAGKRVVEYLGVDTRAPLGTVGWERIALGKQCPYLGAMCAKRRKGKDLNNQPIVIGTCTLRYLGEDVVICPVRFLERQDGMVRIFNDAAELAGIPLEQARYTTEVQVKGGRVDYVVFREGPNGPESILGVEFQTLDTTGSAWPAREAFLESQGVTGAILEPRADEDQKRNLYGMNWRMTAKTILVQLLHKVETFDELGGRLVLAVQSPLWNTMVGSFNFGEITAQKHDPSHVMQFQVYDLVDQGDGQGYRLDNLQRFSATLEQLQTAINIEGDARAGMEELKAKIMGRPRHMLMSPPAPNEVEVEADA